MVTNGLMGLTFGLCGVVIAWHRPSNPIGWLFIADGIGHATTAMAAPLGQQLVDSGAPIVAQRLTVTVFLWSWPWSIALFLPLSLLLFPTGRLLSPRWRWPTIAVVATSPLFVLEMATDGAPPTADVPPGYLTISSYDAFQPLWTATELRNLLALLLAITSLAHQIPPRRRNGPSATPVVAVGVRHRNPLRHPVGVHRRDADPCPAGDSAHPGIRRGRDRALPTARHPAGRVAGADLGAAVVGCHRRLCRTGRAPRLTHRIPGRTVRRGHGVRRPDHRAGVPTPPAPGRPSPVRRSPRPRPGRVPRRRTTVRRPAGCGRRDPLCPPPPVRRADCRQSDRRRSRHSPSRRRLAHRRTAIRRTALRRTALRRTALRRTALRRTALRRTALRRTAVGRTSYRRIADSRIADSRIADRRTAVASDRRPPHRSRPDRRPPYRGPSGHTRSDRRSSSCGWTSSTAVRSSARSRSECVRASPGCRRRTAMCSRWSPYRLLLPYTRPACRPNCSRHARSSSPRAKRNAAGSAATSTTASARR